MSVFGVPAQQTSTFNIYHDESGTDVEHDRFQLHGALIVPTCRMEEALRLLKSVRNGYAGQIHFVDLRDKTRNPKATIAAQWLKLFFTTISDYCFFKCMIVDMHSPQLIKTKPSTPHHFLYNRTALNAIYGGIVWCLSKYAIVNLSIFSEKLTRASNDNFEVYVPWELAKRAGNNKKCPRVVIPLETVTLVNGDPRQVEPELADHCEFIQLTDILTGAVGEAINARASQRIKIDSGKLAAQWIGDTRMPPWLQENRLHRRFSVSCYDGSSKFYNVQLAVLSQGQFKMEKF